ncbi:MAG: DUF1501 domain-containing protein [Pseudomonadota bacterium]
MVTRRSFLGTSLGAACSVAASPMITPVVFAAAPGERRLVVVVLRGGLDGLGIVQPYGDPGFQGLRGPLAEVPGTNGSSDLDGFFAVGGAFSDLLPMWRAGDLGFVHAVSTPYRNKRSHFDGQDFLENGGSRADGQLTRSRDGWLNRAIARIPGARADYAIAVGQDHMMLLDGDAPAGAWSPTNELRLADDERRMLSLLYRADPLFANALSGADMLSGTGAEARRETGATLAAFAARRLNGPARIAAFSMTGWDTHKRQDRAIRRPAAALAEALTTLKRDLGRNWQHTAVLALTEFGRTARVNGSGGTDHGTGGVAVLAGGAVRGGQIYGRWPGLSANGLYQDRDLMPTDDVRRWAAWALAGQFGLGRSALESAIFPGLDLGRDPRFL